MTEPLLDVQEKQFWLEKVMAWGQADSSDSQKDISLHLRRLSSYLQQLLTHINNMSSTTESMKRLPFLGQFLGRLCWNAYVTADDTSRGLLFQCLWGLYSQHPSNALETKANQWIRNVLRQLATEEDDAVAQALMKHLGVPSKEYHLKVLRKMVALLQEKVGKSCSALGDINHSHGLLLEEQAVVSLWCHSLSSLEEAVLSLLQSVLTNTGSTQHKLEQQVSQSLLPKACAQHYSIFLVVNDIFRSTLKHAEGNECVKSLIQTFTCCFLKEKALLQPQMCVPLKVFFPQTPRSLLIPLLTLPSEMPQEAWQHHLNWLSSSLQRLTEEEEEGDENGSNSTSRGHHKVFESWFLLVQCGHWVQVAVQLLGTKGLENCGPLLWLLTFYYHPTNRGHQRAVQLVRTKEAWNHLRSLLSASAHPPSVDLLQPLVTLLSPQPQQPSASPLSILSLLVNVAVFSQQPLSESTHILQTVVDRSGLLQEAAYVLSSLELRLNAGSCSSSNTNRVHVRIKALQNTLTHMNAAWSMEPCCEPDAHTL
ncbi:Fanconi anemia group C protein isoform X2 [Solea solea]|uniref:Fanconi anemia group C protein isoform X2 n=1 Tax=Solea solea TaxID=90069 RepID=UPI00272A261B|nr:Fanconi anemia group C protein isoform X2 [Solea solea]